MSKTIPMEVFKVLTDAVQELKDMLDDVAVVEDFSLKLSTSPDPAHNVDIHVTLHPENADEFVLTLGQ